jgi:hypothetical protein
MVLFAIGGVWLSVGLIYIWTAVVISGMIFKDYYGLRLLIIALWIPSLFVFLALGASFTALAKTIDHCYWALGLGALASVYWLNIRRVTFAEPPSTADLLWSYSQVFVPFFASMLGWWGYGRAKKLLRPTDTTGG